MLRKKIKNCAFIDSQNLNLGIKEIGWNLDFRKFRIYLNDKYSVKIAYIFIGYLPENQSLYRSLQKYGYVLIFKPTLKDGRGEVKGNVDADLVLQAMIDYNKYDKAVIITSDGDFHCLVDYLYKKGKLEVVISPNRDKCSSLITKAAKGKIRFMDNLKKKLEHERVSKMKKHR